MSPARRRFLLILGMATGAAMAAVVLAAPWWVSAQVRRAGPPGLRFQSCVWDWPLGVSFRSVLLSHPEDSAAPPVLKIERVRLQVPPWALMIRPLPVKVWLESPKVVLDAQTAEDLLRQVNFLPMGEAWSEEGKEKPAPEFSLKSLPAVPVGLTIADGSFFLWDKSMISDRPIFGIHHLNLALELASPFRDPTIFLEGKGDFVRPNGDPAGFLSAQAEAAADLSRITGQLQIWYTHLEDFRESYRFAPEPLTLDAGAGGPIIRWDFDNGELNVSMESITEGFKISGSVHGVPWQSIFDSLADSNGRIDLTVETHARIDEPNLDLHHRILSELDLAMREQAAAAGIRVPGRLFFGLEAGERASETAE